jgi:23S rRNA-/tRNA-specific pseudouridylate synthase
MRTLNKAIILAVFVVNILLNVSLDVIGIQPRQQYPSSPTTHTFFPVLFESPRVLVVRKPHGISHHDEPLSSQSVAGCGGDGESISPGVLTLLRNERRQQAEEMGERLYGVHRLDKVTSGILVLAKDATTASTLSDYFARGEIQKVYFGLSAKKPQKKKQGLVQGGMTRSRNKSWKLVRKPKNGKQSLKNFAKTRFFTTGFNVVDNSNIDPMHNVKTVVMFRPYTGKTHQLRVAAKAMGIPLLGDPIYKDGGESKNSREDMTSAFSRTMLHASGIHIPEFQDQAEINVWCPPTFFHDGNDDKETGIREEIDKENRKSRAHFSESLDLAVEKLMTKNCDVPGILETLLMQQRDQQEE